MWSWGSVAPPGPYKIFEGVVQILLYSQVHESFAVKCCASGRSNPQGVVFAKINFLSKLTLS